MAEPQKPKHGHSDAKNNKSHLPGSLSCVRTCGRDQVSVCVYLVYIHQEEDLSLSAIF